MKRTAIFLAVPLVTALTLTAVASPASAHGSWPDGSTTGPTQSLTSSAGDQVFTSACGSPPCLDFVSRVHVTGKIVAGSDHVAIVTDSDVEGDDSDDLALETTGSGAIIMQDSLIHGDYDIAASYGRNITIERTEIYDLPASGVIALMANIIEDNYIHDFNTNAMTYAFGIQMFDVWQGYPTPIGASVVHNFVWLDGNQTNSLYAAPAFGTNAYSEWQIHNNFFIGGVNGVFVDNSSGDVGNVNFYENHIWHTDTLAVDVSGAASSIGVCANESDDFFTASAWSSPEGDAC